MHLCLCWTRVKLLIESIIVNFFRELLKREMSPLVLRLLLFMYTNQTLRVKWGSVMSESFTVMNGVKQARQTLPNSGGVAEGHLRFDKGAVAIIFYFLRVKNRTF